MGIFNCIYPEENPAAWGSIPEAAGLHPVGTARETRHVVLGVIVGVCLSLYRLFRRSGWL